MAGSITINGTDRSSVVPFHEVEIAESAYLGEVGDGSLVIEDNTGLLTAPGWKLVTVTESLAGRIGTGYVGRKLFSRGGTSISSNGRTIGVAFHDLNVRLGWRILKDAKRPRETVSERVNWLLGTSEVFDWANGQILFTDQGNVASSSVVMDRADYKGQTPGDVLAACAKAARFNYYLRYHDTSEAGCELVFRDDNESTDDTTAASISNAGDDNGSTIFAPLDPEMEEDPTDVFAGAYSAHAGGAIYETRASTASNFAWRDGVLEDSGTRKHATAALEARKFLWESEDEEQTATLTLELPPEHLNLFPPGWRVSTRLTHLTPEGWEPARYARILRRRVTQPLNPEDHYRVTLDLAPQGAAPAEFSVTTAVSSVQEKSVGDGGDTQLSFDNPVTIGNLLVAGLVSRNDADPTMIAGGGWTHVGGTTATAYNGYGAPQEQRTAIRFYAKTATSTSKVVEREATESTIWMYAWEIENATLADITLLSLSRQPDSPMSLGTFSGAYGFAVMACGITRGTDQANNGYACTPGTGWTELVDSAIAGAPFGGFEPWVYYAKASPTGGSLAATATVASTVQNQTVGEWGGIAILFPSVTDPGECLFERTPSTVFYPLGGQQNTPNLSPGNVFYLHPGLTWPETPTPGFRGRWYWPTYGNGGGGQGTTDYMGACVGNVLRFAVVGDGTLTIHTAASGDTLDFDVAQYGPRTGSASWTYVGRYSAGDTVTVTINDTTAPNDCARIIDVYGIGGVGKGGCGGKLGWTSASWVAEA